MIEPQRLATFKTASLLGEVVMVEGEDNGGSVTSILSAADCLQLISTVDAIEVLEAFKRIPDEFRGFTFFGVDDRWLYIKSGNPKLCENCSGYDGEVFYGDSLRTEFPYLRIIDENTINPHVHPHCECLLNRVPA